MLQELSAIYVIRKGTMTPVTNKIELTQRIANLPNFSKRVYQILQSEMYAEPGYSSVTPQDVAHRIKRNVQSVAGALTRLQRAGLIYLDQGGVNGVPMTFIHTYEHDMEIV